MDYSPSQLDAIGDIDPVAEADVYLAYGRDLQAEEILKEALRADPERLAIRSKLLEVYAKRRDTKGFELLATQLYGLTGGQGEEWAQAQALGAQIDADHPLYRPGGGRQCSLRQRAQAADLVNPSTMPQSVTPAPRCRHARIDAARAGAQCRGTGSRPIRHARCRRRWRARGRSAAQRHCIGRRAATAGPPSTPICRSTSARSRTRLDLSVAAAAEPPGPRSRVRCRAWRGDAIETTDFELPLDLLPERDAGAADPAGHSASARPGRSLDFDISDLGELPFGLDAPATLDGVEQRDDARHRPGRVRLRRARSAAEPRADPAAGARDALERKLELAEEFRQIGDAEGARELLLEVVARATGAQRTRAQSMLDALS